MFSVISRLFTKLDLVDCSFLFKPVDNYTTLTPKPKSEEMHNYFTEPNVCLSEVSSA